MRDRRHVKCLTHAVISCARMGGIIFRALGLAVVFNSGCFCCVCFCICVCACVNPGQRDLRVAPRGPPLPPRAALLEQVPARHGHQLARGRAGAEPTRAEVEPVVLLTILKHSGPVRIGAARASSHTRARARTHTHTRTHRTRACARMRPPPPPACCLRRRTCGGGRKSCACMPGFRRVPQPLLPAPHCLATGCGAGSVWRLVVARV